LKRSALALIAQIMATAAISLLAIRAAGAGTASVAVQGAAFLIGAASRMARPGRGSRLISAAAILVVAVLMLTTGVEMQGAHRWLALGPVLIHPASLLGAPLLWLVAQDADDGWTAGVAALTILTFGLGFDGAASLAFALGTMGLLAAARRSWKTLAPLAALAWILALWSLMRLGALPRVPYVEDVVPTVWAMSPILGVAAGLALVVLSAPLLWMGWRAQGVGAAVGLAMAGFWIGLSAANLLGAYPAPVVGYGASPVIGWLVAIGLAMASARRTRFQ
jgi:cell division protein FtsW (lipid II flippase)